jgi:Zn-finger nucleic acid-binding protein
MKCPIDHTELEAAGRTFKCEKCDGAWVLEDVLVAMLEQSANTLVELPWQPRPIDQLRPCAECGEPMQTVMLGTVALDRCVPHGVWFDRKELAAVLGQAKKFRETDPHNHHGLLDRLSKLVHGH